MRSAAAVLVLVLAGPRLHVVSATRVSQDSYSFVENAGGRRISGVVQTAHCWFHGRNERAVVRYVPNDRRNRIMFERDGTTCEVRTVTFGAGGGWWE